MPLCCWESCTPERQLSWVVTGHHWFMQPPPTSSPPHTISLRLQGKEGEERNKCSGRPKILKGNFQNSCPCDLVTWIVGRSEGLLSPYQDSKPIIGREAVDNQARAKGAWAHGEQPWSWELCPGAWPRALPLLATPHHHHCSSQPEAPSGCLQLS